MARGRASGGRSAAAERGGEGLAAAGPPLRESSARARTRALLLDAAVRVFARKGAGAAAIHEITDEAGVANGTFYNYFRSREELVEAATLRLAHHLDGRIAASRAAVEDPAERVAIGCRRFVLQALVDPTWGGAMLRVWASSPVLSEGAAAGLLVDLRAGRRGKRFLVPSERAAIDLVQGAVLAGMRTVLEGHAGPEHASAVAAVVLRGLGVPADESLAIAQHPLPPLAGRDGPSERPAAGGRDGAMGAPGAATRRVRGARRRVRRR